jgi:hypothetical protein
MVCLLAAAITRQHCWMARSASRIRSAPPATDADTMLDVSEVRASPHIIFRSTADGPTYGRLALAPLARPDGPRAVTS